MRAERCALYTAVYPGVEPFLGAWHASVLAQEDLDGVELCVGLDGLTPADVVRAAGGDVAARWLEHPAGTSPAAMRSAALGRLAAEYDVVVLVDADDVLASGRVGAARAALADADAAACALRLMDASGRDLGRTFCAEPMDDPAALLPRWNVFGLSNTAYRAETLRRCLPLPAECALPDWLLATRAWLAGAAMALDTVPRMWYRRHAANTAPAGRPFAPAEVLRATELVLGHYACLLDGAWPMPPARRDELAAVRAGVRRFRRAMTASLPTLHRYVARLNDLPERPVWWWCVANPALEDLWSD
jgi:hypothetical protein